MFHQSTLLIYNVSWVTPVQQQFKITYKYDAAKSTS